MLTNETIKELAAGVVTTVKAYVKGQLDPVKQDNDDLLRIIEDLNERVTILENRDA